MDEGELGSEGAENGDGGGLVVDVDAALAVGEDFAAEDDFVGVHVDAVGFEDELGAGSGFEDAGEDGAVGSVADDAGGGFLAHEEGEGVDEDGLACAGFAGEEIEAGTEAGDGVIDDGVVLGSEFEQHGVRVQGTENRVQGTGCRVQGTGCGGQRSAVSGRAQRAQDDTVDVLGLVTV